jgi:hypothetical protein
MKVLCELLVSRAGADAKFIQHVPIIQCCCGFVSYDFKELLVKHVMLTNKCSMLILGISKCLEQTIRKPQGQRIDTQRQSNLRNL